MLKLFVSYGANVIHLHLQAIKFGFLWKWNEELKSGKVLVVGFYCRVVVWD
ncbi:hypothetical protein RchiOBHm_Chr6g0300051 [Rosa chinensis]|uniref:Uncharacterized protein n=1 Tax=Rosa chinensis TaxID=74649 RepID=A0A2P6PYE6_ROSCH|nr:hypothetical protein RchiOBHm_Chr6g0300051 [Rosa chinensis]